MSPLEVIDKVGHADLDGGAGDADRAHDKAHAVLLPGEHMLNLRADYVIIVGKGLAAW